MKINKIDRILINDFLERCSNVAFIALDGDSMNELSEIINRKLKILDLDDDFTPIAPFLSILTELKPTEDHIISNVYSIQRNTFSSYFKNGIVDFRYDLIYETEVDYEKSRYADSIAALLNTLNKDDYLILNAQKLCDLSLDIIKGLELSDNSKRFIFALNIKDSENNSTNFNNFIEEISSKENYLDITEIEVNDFQSFEIKNPSTKDIFPGTPNFDFLYRNIRNFCAFLSLDQAISLSEWIDDNIQNFSYTPQMLIKILLEVAKSYFYKGVLDKAALYLTKILENKPEGEDLYQALIYQTKVFYIKKDLESAKKYCNILDEILKNNKETPFYALNKMNEYLIAKRSDSRSLQTIYKKGLQCLEKFNLMNNYVAMGVLIPWMIVGQKDYRDFIETQLDKCYDTAIKIGNKHLVSSAAQWKGINYSNFGESDRALGWYQEANRLRTEIGEIEPLINIRNGLSYEALCKAKYELSYTIVNDVSIYLYQINDISKIIDTLKNVGYTLVYSRHFEQADRIFKVILRFLRLFDFKKSPYCSFMPSLPDILIFKSIIDIDRSDYIHAKLNFLKIFSNEKAVTYNQKPLITFLNALLQLSERNLSSAEKLFDKTIAEFNKMINSNKYQIVFICIEFAALLKRFGYSIESDKYFNAAMKIAREEKFTYYLKSEKENYKDVLNFLENIPVFEKLKINLEFLEERADKEQLFNLVYKKISDYQFLNNVNSINTTKLNKKEYIDKIIELVTQYTSSQNINLCDYTSGTVHIIFEGKKKIFSKEKWTSYIEKYKNTSSKFVFDNEDLIYFANIYHKDLKAGIIIDNGKNHLSSDIINTLQIALVNIESQLIIYKQNEELLFYSSTDQLSLLKNRHALQEYLNDLKDEIKENNDTQTLITICFIDLDNFKYYNDSFNHEAGDYFIKLFAGLLSSTASKRTFISRFGGDEFVVVMKNKDISEAKALFNNIKKELENNKHFIPQLKNFLKDDSIKIPKEKYLNFSMGISSSDDVVNKYDLDKVLSFADQALYYSKENGKGKAIVWNQIKV